MTTTRLSAILALGLLAGCVQPVAGPAIPTPPPAPALPPAPHINMPRVVAPPPVAVPAAPVVPTGPVDGRSGLHQASVISISGDADSRFTVLFRPSQTTPRNIEAAPSALCRQAGRDVADSRTNKPGSASAMPGVQMMIVTCSAA